MAERKKRFKNFIAEKNEFLQDITDRAVVFFGDGLNRVPVAIRRALRKGAEAFSTEKEGCVARAACKAQEICDEWVDITAEQLSKDIRLFKRIAGKAAGRICRWFSVSEPTGLSKFMASVVSGYDFRQEVVLDNLEFQLGRLKKAIMVKVALAWEARLTALRYSTGAVIVLICMISVFNYATGYEYSYNGRVLGLVKNQEDVAKVVEIAAKGLTKEYGVDVRIDIDKDFSFRKVVIVDRTTDTPDQVLAKLTYMQDARATAYGIYANNAKIATVGSEKTAETVLRQVLSRYIDRGADYDKTGFAEKIEIREITSRVGKLMNHDVALETILGGKGAVSYKVAPKDTLESILDDFNMTESYFKALNSSVEKIEEGDIVTVSESKPLVTVKTKHKEVYKKKLKYKTKRVKTNALYEGDTAVHRKGRAGTVKITAEIVCKNGEETERNILSKKTVKEPVDRIVYVGTKERPSYIGSGNLINPCPAGYRSSGFGSRWGRLHRGIDLACGVGNPIYAADGGIVVTATYNYSYGNYVKINHQNGMVTTYAHCSELLVHVGDKVAKGQQIARVGNTGNSTGAHCHFEVEVNGELRNPAGYF